MKLIIIALLIATGLQAQTQLDIHPCNNPVLVAAWGSSESEVTRMALKAGFEYASTDVDRSSDLKHVIFKKGEDMYMFSFNKEQYTSLSVIDFEKDPAKNTRNYLRYDEQLTTGGSKIKGQPGTVLTCADNLSYTINVVLNPTYVLVTIFNRTLTATIINSEED